MTVDALTMTKFEKITEDLLCSICNTVMDDPHALHCGHSFCGQCILTWLKVKKACPMCRVTIIRIPTHINVLQKLADTLRPTDDVPGERLNECDWLELFPANSRSNEAQQDEDSIGLSPPPATGYFGVHLLFGENSEDISYDGHSNGSGMDPNDDNNSYVASDPASPSESDNEYDDSHSFPHSIDNDHDQYPRIYHYSDSDQEQSDDYSEQHHPPEIEYEYASSNSDVGAYEEHYSHGNSSQEEQYYSGDQQGYSSSGASQQEQEIYSNHHYSSEDEQQYSSDNQQHYSSDDEQHYSSDDEQHYSSDDEEQYPPNSYEEEHHSCYHGSSDDGPDVYSNTYSSQGEQEEYYSDYPSDVEPEQYSNSYPSDEEPEQYSNSFPSDEEPEQYSDAYPSGEEQYNSGYPSPGFSGGYSSPGEQEMFEQDVPFDYYEEEEVQHDALDMMDTDDDNHNYYHSDDSYY